MLLPAGFVADLDAAQVPEFPEWERLVNWCSDKRRGVLPVIVGVGFSAPQILGVDLTATVEALVPVHAERPVTDG